MKRTPIAAIRQRVPEMLALLEQQAMTDAELMAAMHATPELVRDVKRALRDEIFIESYDDPNTPRIRAGYRPSVPRPRVETPVGRGGRRPGSGRKRKEKK